MASSLSLDAWMYFVAGIGRAHGAFIAFPIMMLLAVALGYLQVPPEIAGISIVLPILIVAGWTIDHGDDDGLWGLIFLVLLATIPIVAAVTSAVSRATRARFTRLRPRNPIKHLITIAAAAVVAAIAISFIAWPNTLGDLDRALARFEVPAGFTDVVTYKASGDPLCSTSCLASAATTMRTHVTVEEACARLEAALRSWLNDLQDSPTSGNRCTFEGETTEGRTGALRAHASVQGDTPPFIASITIGTISRPS